jgi:hypothetical protein
MIDAAGRALAGDLVVPLARTAEAVGKQVMADQLGEGPCPLALPVTADLRHRDLEIIVEDRQRHTAEEGEARDMTIKERLGRLARNAFTKQASDCARSRQKKWIFWRTPPITPTASPKSTCP